MMSRPLMLALFVLCSAPLWLHRGAKAHCVPDWVSHYAKTFDGPATPSKSVAVGSETYTLAWVCKAHDCGDNQLNVLFRREANALGPLPTVRKRAGSANLTPGSKPPIGVARSSRPSE